MADHSQKWHDETTNRNIRSSSKDGLAALLGCQIYEGPHLDKDCPLNEEVKQVEEETSWLNKLHGVSFISGPESNTPEVLQHQLPPKELNPGNFTLPCMIGKFHFYAMADLGAIINVMLRSIFEHLHFINLKKTNMLCEMADMFKKAPLGIVESVLVKIDKFLFPSDFVILDNTPSETTILGRPFLATIHAKIDVFTGRIFLGTNKDRISFDTMRKDHNPSEIFFMVIPQSPGQSNNQIDCEVPGNWDNRSPNFDDRDPKKRKINLDENVPRAHFYNLIKQNIKEQTKMCPSCDPGKKMCDGGVEICRSSSEASSQESNKQRPRDYTFRECTLIKVRHTDISEPVKKALLKLWLIDGFQDDSAIVNNPTHRRFDDYKWKFNLEIDKLADEYELGIGKKGHILDNIWENCNQVHNKNYEWHNYEFENEECEEIGIEGKDYHPPKVQVETFEVKKYSFEGGQSSICVTKDLDNILPLVRKNRSKFKDMIRKEVKNNKT
ncbi:RNA-directed DNA polymerase, eukaryota, reverse transcriptase zinc-binding domain protein [Tanacetum coccineum]|uniref:RNA-directed DNA polymerase, eukaryota, reverse transcriptase zinc-binding domain protein n=1 Tax=Tanacetum coccineum TaxID=301880 RepID=A0ABQ4XTZ1_9ASTR